MFASVRKFLLSNLLYQPLALSCHLLILHNCNPVFYGHLWIPVYRKNKGDWNLQVQFITAQTAVTRQKRAIIWSAGVNWKPHPQQECRLLLSVRECCSFAEGAGVGSCWGHLPSNNSFLLLRLHLQLEWPAWTKGFLPRASICKAIVAQH